MEKENKHLEYKENATKSYLKTVSAFANYHTGRIVFGITDDYQILPIKDQKAFRENLENQINDSIAPQPEYSLSSNQDGTITLAVYKGENQPYLYHGKAFKRNDTATIECDDLELRRLILLGKKIDYETLPYSKGSLSFSFIGTQLKKRMGLENFSLDTLKTLELYSDKRGYNNAAALLADTNSFPGLDIAVFGDNENIIKERYSFFGRSLVEQYFSAIEVFKRYYSYEEIRGALREKKVLIPEEAFRETIANSLIHRTYDVKANTKIAMYPDHILVSSPGGLPVGINKEQYLDGDFSVLRNPIIANVFHRLGIVEVFATGINRIKSSYKTSYSKPTFIVKDDSIGVLLPLTKKETDLSENEQKILDKMKNATAYSRQELEKMSYLSKPSLIRAINNLIDKGIVCKIGKSSKTAYIRK